MRLEGKVAIVTGGGKGIGKAYAKGLANEGAKVVVADIDGTATQATAQEIAGQGGQALPVTVDVADESSIRNMVKQAVDRYGRLDILVNNAALFAVLPDRTLDEITIQDWDRVMSVNVRGPFLCARAALPQMKSQNSGSVINISSTTVLNGGPGRSMDYVVSKAAVIGFTRALAKEVGDNNIRVNTVAPGATASETVLQHRDVSVFERRAAVRCLKRVETPEDLVGAIVFLASDESAFITGQIIVVDGGLDFI